MNEENEVDIKASDWDPYQAYKDMVLIREFEAEAERQYKAARIGGYCHLAIGQEATTVGIVDAMNPKDLLITGYRCHGFALAKGISPEAVMAELFGKEDGCSRGRGGSMHLLDPSRGYYGGWGIVAGQLPIATGLALALKQQGKQAAVVCELGEGAVNMGAWHESLNLAAVWNLPVIFLVINNVYGMGTSIERASAETEVYKRAKSYNMVGEQVDGNNLFAVHEVAEQLLERARKDGTPAVLEAKTYRHRGHSIADAGLNYRTREEIAREKDNDPIPRCEKVLKLSQSQIDDVLTESREAVAAAVEFAKNSPDPKVSELALGMYSPESAEQFSRMSPGAPIDDAKVLDFVQNPTDHQGGQE